MNRVFSQQKRPLAEMGHAAIAIKEVSQRQRHTGILYRESDSGNVKFLHLAWHHDLNNHPPGLSYHWVDPAIPAPRLRQVAAKCRQIFRANPHGIPYGFSLPDDSFDLQTFEYLIGPTRHGLTCATFVLAVFEFVGLRLIQYESWPTRPDDVKWQEFVISRLECHNPPATAEHIEAIRDEIGGIRIRPEEVAGAATLPNHPLGFKAVLKLAQGILNHLQSSQQ